MKLLLLLILAIPLGLTSAHAGNVEIAASMLDGMWACKSPSDFMQMISHVRSNNAQALLNDIAIYVQTGRCIDLQKAQAVYIESEPLGDLLCVRPEDQSFCYWTPSGVVRPNLR
jgi:hypothetical protein